MKLLASTIVAASLVTGGVGVYAVEEPEQRAPAAEERADLAGWQRVVTDFNVWTVETHAGLHDQLMATYCATLR
jgi:hypothetical protein